MRGELPNFKRCCFCCPLRRGLLFWGYFKLMIATILLYPMALSIMFFMHLMILGPLGYILNFLLFITLLLDLAFNIALVIAGHTKNHKIFRAYYYYTITLTVVAVALSAAFYIIMLVDLQSHGDRFSEDFPHNLNGIIWCFIATFAYLVLQVYIILLVRSEALKLKNDGLFHFVNNEAEAECTLNMNLEADHDKNMKKIITEKENNNDNV